MSVQYIPYEKVQVGKDQEKAQSEKDSHSKNQDGKKKLTIKTHIYMEKMGYAGVHVYLIFLFLIQNIHCGYSLESPR